MLTGAFGTKGISKRVWKEVLEILGGDTLLG